MRKAEMTVEWSLNVVCPYCTDDIDVSAQDDDNRFGRNIFNNDWNAIVGMEVHCYDCSRDFTISKVEC